ncbi:hypothetical protein BKA70DRAFT_738612 [Coprinopsis sp. MPI-PUGE-AT-0042]|nr:hypothetical protein BKA70DRAFT_738612 [Coprinopsis sp. MPI-PUGE-AT-0042]
MPSGAKLMSDSDAERAALTQRLKLGFQFASLAMLYYDYLLTLPDEVTYIWRSKWRLSSLFYIFCRYALVANLIYYLSIENPEIMDCDTGYIICGVLSIFGHIGIIAVWGLRTYAICDKNKYIAALLGLPGITTIVLLIVRAPVQRCKGPVQFAGIRGGISASMVVFDILAFSLASLRAWRTIRADRKARLSVKSSADYVIFSQGLAYMAPVFLLSVATLALNWKVDAKFTRFMNGFKLPIAGLLTSRFLLELRKWEYSTKRRGDPDSLSLPHYHSSTINDHSGEFSGSASVPRFSVQGTSTRGSLFEELGGDIGPRRWRNDELDDDDIEITKGDEDYEVETEMEEERRAPTSATKGKRRGGPGGQAEGNDESEVLSQSARRSKFSAQLEVSPSFAGPSQFRGRVKSSPTTNTIQ